MRERDEFAGHLQSLEGDVRPSLLGYCRLGRHDSARGVHRKDKFERGANPIWTEGHKGQSLPEFSVKPWRRVPRSNEKVESSN